MKVRFILYLVLLSRNGTLFNIKFFKGNPQRVLGSPQHFILLDDLANITLRRKFDRVLRANGGAGGATHHAHLRGKHNRFIPLVIKSINVPTTGCDAHAAADAAIFNYSRIPLNR